jgi:glutathione synthase/RimK-type ligase-like ATP-grasp enzyme
MKIGIYGSRADSQCQLLEKAITRRGAKVVLLDSSAITQGEDFSYANGNFIYQGSSLEEIGGWFLRFVMSPLPPFFRAEDQYVLFKDWFNEYMHRQECTSFELAMLLSWSARGIPVVNPPENGGVLQIKTFQLDVARQAGLTTPGTLVTNQKARVLEFQKTVGDVVYKPSMGGALCRVLDQSAIQELDSLAASPVIFQENIKGTGVRVTIVGEEVVSCVRIPSTTLDYRENPAYVHGDQIYVTEHLPEKIKEQSLALMRKCGLFFAGIDFILQEDGRWVFLEANSSPIYLDIERKTHAPITDALADYLLLLANDPDRYHQAVKQGDRTKSFIKYSLGK